MITKRELRRRNAVQQQIIEDYARVARSSRSATTITYFNRPTPAPIDRDELKAVIMSCGPDPAPAEVADAVVAWLGE